MDNTKIVRVLRTVCHPDDEDKFNHWYNEVHAPQVFKHPACISATRCKITNSGLDFPEYITIYEFRDQDGFDDYEATRSSAAWKEELVETWGRDPNAAGEPGQRGFYVKDHWDTHLIKTWKK